MILDFQKAAASKLVCCVTYCDLGAHAVMPRMVVGFHVCLSLRTGEADEGVLAVGFCR